VRKLVILLTVLAVLFVGVDRVSVYVAQRALAAELKSSEHLPRDPVVTIGGFPFLTQLARGRFSRIGLRAPEVSLVKDGRTLTMTDLSVSMRGISTNRTFSSVLAQTVSGTASVGYPTLSGLLGVPVSYGGQTSDGKGRIKATEKLTVLGRQVSASAAAELRLPAVNTLGFANVTALGVAVPSVLVSSLHTVFAKSLTLRGFPVGLRLTGVTSAPDGVRFTLGGAHVRIR
jgi:hypothetical protein